MKLRSIQALRGIAVLGVVAFHAALVERKYSGGDRLLPDFLSFGETGVDLFFVISGFVMVTVTQGRFGGMRELPRFLWSRITRIYPTYWFYFFITLAIFLVKPEWVNASEGNQAQLLASFLLLPSEQLPLVMVGWSLIHELWFYLIFAGLLLFKQWLLLPALMVWTAVILAGNQAVDVNALSPGMRVMLHPYTLEFTLGALAAIAYHSHYMRTLPVVLGWVGVAGVLLGLPIAYTSDLLIDDASMQRAGVLGCLYAVLVLALALLEQRKSLPVPRSLQFVGDISYTVYLSHILVLSVLGRLWSLAGASADSWLDNFIVLFVMFAAVITYGWVGYRLVERPTIDFSHRLRTRWLKRA